MKLFAKNTIKKAVVLLTLFSLIFTFPVYAAAAESNATEVSMPQGRNEDRKILTSGSTNGYVTGDYTSSRFTTKWVFGTLHHGMSYYLETSSASTNFTLHMYKSDGTELGTGTPLAKNFTSASCVFVLDKSMEYYFKVVPSNENVSYSFSYNIYYY